LHPAHPARGANGARTAKLASVDIHFDKVASERTRAAKTRIASGGSHTFDGLPNPAEPEPRGLPGLQAPDPGLQEEQFLGSGA
jgi:hypothetical protein